MTFLVLLVNESKILLVNLDLTRSACYSKLSLLLISGISIHDVHINMTKNPPISQKVTEKLSLNR